MDDKEKGLPLHVFLYRKWREETEHYFNVNGCYGGCFWLLVKLGVVLLVLTICMTLLIISQYPTGALWTQ